MKSVVKFLIFPITFGFGFILFLFTKKTSNIAYISFRYLFVSTNGRVNDFHSRLISLVKKPKKTTLGSILNLNSEKDIDHICSEITKNGYFQFDISLEKDKIDSLENFGRTTPARYVDVNKSSIAYSQEKILFDPEKIDSPRYQFDVEDVVQNETVRSIIFDQGFLSIASKYLKCSPILDIVTMWWSKPANDLGKSQAAQMYHFDMDRIKFLKFFFYVTDVDTQTGPHCYIENSHKRLDRAVRKDRRLTDEELLAHYPKTAFKEFNGKKGTILAVDTRGLHKGKALETGERLLFQIQFSNSLFGAEYAKMKIDNPSTSESEFMQLHARTFQLF
ncbi:MAG: phytanoyl-CoA dioxygenase family protein, partial [Fluviicola sp.]